MKQIIVYLKNVIKDNLIVCLNFLILFIDFISIRIIEVNLIKKVVLKFTCLTARSINEIITARKVFISIYAMFITAFNKRGIRCDIFYFLILY